MATPSAQDFYTTQIGTRPDGHPVFLVNVPEPPFGYRGYMIEKKGVYVLASQPGVIGFLAVSHVGSGTVRVLDAIPTKDGQYLAPPKEIFKQNPQTMCLWALEAGFENGLTVEAVGGSPATPVFLSVSWNQAKEGAHGAA